MEMKNHGGRLIPSSGEDVPLIGEKKASIKIKGVVRDIFVQFFVLCYKVFLQMLKSPIFLVLMIFTGVTLVTFVSVLNFGIGLLNRGETSPLPVAYEAGYPSCDTPGCFSIFHNRKENLEVMEIIDAFVLKYGLNESEVLGFSGDAKDEINDYLFYEAPSSLKNGLLFKYGVSSDNSTLPADTEILVQRDADDRTSAGTLIAFVTHLRLNKKMESYDISLPAYDMKYMQSTYNEGGSTSSTDFSLQGGVIMMLYSFIIPIIILVIMIVHEKENQLRFLMKLMGLRFLPFWTSYLIYFYLFLTINILLFVSFGWIFGLQLVRGNNVFIFVTYMLLSSYVMVPFFLILATLVNRVRVVIIIFFVLLIVITISSFVPWSFVMNMELHFPEIHLDRDTLFSLIMFYAQAFMKYVAPFFSPYLSIYGFQAFSGTGSILSAASGPIEFSNIFSNYDYLSIGYHYIWLGIDGIIYTLLFCYLDLVISGRNGKGLPWYFLVSPHYWFGVRFFKMHINYYTIKRFLKEKLFRKSVQLEEEVIMELLDRIEDEDVVEERVGVAAGSFNSDPIVVNGIHKYFPGILRTFHAVNGCSFHVGESEVFGLLGPNGAGKTTTFNMLIGLFQPTFGDIKVHGLSCSDEIGQIRGILGVCPQDNYLWGDLTVTQHLYIFSLLKKVPFRLVRNEIETRLRQVKLVDARNRKASKLSGGMRRRLSLAIALVGDPPVIVLDEPTTGLDPKTRQDIWKVILSCKVGKSILLTTHSMEEADYLSDRIAIVANGRIRCIGDSLTLKNRYGSGYKLNILAESGSVPSIKVKLIEEGFPINFFGETMTSIIVQIDIENRGIVSKICKYVESLVDNEKSPLLNYSISQSTMTEVFLNISKATKAERKGVSLKKQAKLYQKRSLDINA